MFSSRGNRSFVAAALGLALGSAALQAGATNFHTARAGAVRRPLLPGRHRQQDQLGSSQGRGRAAHVPGRAGSSRDDRLARRRRVRAPAAAAGVERAASFAQRHRAVGRRLPGPVRHHDARARLRLAVAERRVDRTDEHRDALHELAERRAEQSRRDARMHLSARHRGSPGDRPERRLRLERRRRASPTCGATSSSTATRSPCPPRPAPPTAGAATRPAHRCCNFRRRPSSRRMRR